MHTNRTRLRTHSLHSHAHIRLHPPTHTLACTPGLLPPVLYTSPYIALFIALADASATHQLIVPTSKRNTPLRPHVHHTHLRLPYTPTLPHPPPLSLPPFTPSIHTSHTYVYSTYIFHTDTSTLLKHTSLATLTSTLPSLSLKCSPKYLQKNHSAKYILN